ncbi:MAG: glycosyltransferase family 2 protein [Alphaproteobacteria bacterium]|nr:glycosyltransferase family 2 protein [Alphaproteobacteria bacterium]
MKTEHHPFFTITTPTYNRAHLLPVLFKSLLSQTFKDFEWVIGDDGSTDNTQELIKSFIKNADFPIIYLRLEHGGKYNACNEMIKHISGEYVVGIDSDDELFAKDTLKDIFDTIYNLPKDKTFWGVGCQFISQDGKIFPPLDTDYIDIDKDTFFKLFTLKPYMLNYFSVIKAEYIKPHEHKDTDNLAYYPEIVDILLSVLQSKDYRIRLFKKNWYKYNMYQPDSVTVLCKDSVVFWIETVAIINLFYQYGLDKKYPQFIHIKLNELGRKIYKQKGFKATLNALKSNKAKKYFIYAATLRRFLRFLFLIDKQINRIKVYLFGIKIMAFKRNY